VLYSHVMVGANDLAASKRFYDAVLGVLGVPPGRVQGERIFYSTQGGIFGVSRPVNGQAATPANGGTIGFLCSSAEQARAWHDAGIAHGGETCEDPPGVRESDGRQAFLAYLRDPDGNKLCAVYWIRRSARAD
jgi:catechol 2,3-dioxygenase-like lactoylglutathione lyase family enzyme